MDPHLFKRGVVLLYMNKAPGCQQAKKQEIKNVPMLETVRYRTGVPYLCLELIQNFIYVDPDPNSTFLIQTSKFWACLTCF